MASTVALQVSIRLSLLYRPWASTYVSRYSCFLEDQCMPDIAVGEDIVGIGVSPSLSRIIGSVSDSNASSCL